MNGKKIWNLEGRENQTGIWYNTSHEGFKKILGPRHSGFTGMVWTAALTLGFYEAKI